MEMDVAQPMKQTAYDLLEESRTAMEEIAAKMLFIKKEGRPKSDLRELITQMSLHFVTLRQVNRSILLEEDRVKAETENAKQPVDFTTLQLHNLMYEKNHYVKAIKTCKDFKSKYPNITLVPDEEFSSAAPEEIKGSVMSNDSTHDLMLKRLNYELFQRKELCKLHEKLEQHKKGLLETIANRKKFLSSLPSHLKSLKKASLPVQQQLGMLHTKKLKQHRAAELLPPPLYIVYSQLLSQKEAFGENIEMEVLGSIKDAQAFAQQQATKDNGISTIAENSKVDDDAPEEEDDGQRRRKRPKKVLGKDDLDHSGIYISHPLHVILHIYDDQDRDAKPLKLISLRFEYLVKLNVVCTGIEGAEEGPDRNILCNLFPDDTGMELPHQTAKLYNGNSVAFEEKKTLRPYKWAQHLAGMDFLPEICPLLPLTESPSSETLRDARVLSGLTLYRHQNRVQTVVQRIRFRKKAQLALVEQLESLSNLKWPSLAHENVPWALHTPTCALQHWSSLGLTPDSVPSFSAIADEQVRDSLDLNLEGRSETLREDAENTREDGELPSALQFLSPPDDSKLTPSKRSSDLEHSRSLALITKSMTYCSSSKGKPQNLGKNEDTSELLFDSDSDMEQVYMEPETENMTLRCSAMAEKSWEEYAVKEYLLVLKKMDRDRPVNLEAKIKISMEYPLRPPLFSLSLSTDGTQGDSVSHEKDGFRWYNKLRAMEAEVNLHILKILSLDCGNYILAHQVHCLAMLFDFQLDRSQTCTETGKSTSIIDVGLCQPVVGRILARSFRGRDRRKMISWKGMECTQGYP